MDLFEALSAEHRDRLLASAITLRLQTGELLLRRGEQGGDLYRLDAGTLQVIDVRHEPPMVLAVVGRGALVGEMAFLDGSVRSADVRAAEECVCQLWRRDVLQEILDEEPELGRSFYRALADLVTERSRNVRTVALDKRTNATLGETELALVSQLRRRLLAVEPRLRTDPVEGRAEVLGALDTFLEALIELSTQLGIDTRAAALDRVSEHVRPWVIRSHLGELAIATPSGSTDDPTVLGHVLAGHAQGDGELGTVIDAWLLALPTPSGLRGRAEAALAAIVSAAPARVVVVNGAGSGLADRIATALPAAEVLRVDGAPLTAWVLGDLTIHHEAVDLVVVDGLLDSLPDKLVGRVLAQAHGWCAPAGRLIATTLAPARDAELFRHLLCWPQVHRRERWVAGLAFRAGFQDVQVDSFGVGLVLSARRL